MLYNLWLMISAPFMLAWWTFTDWRDWRRMTPEQRQAENRYWRQRDAAVRRYQKFGHY